MYSYGHSISIYKIALFTAQLYVTCGTEIDKILSRVYRNKGVGRCSWSTLFDALLFVNTVLAHIMYQ